MSVASWQLFGGSELFPVMEIWHKILGVGAWKINFSRELYIVGAIMRKKMDLFFASFVDFFVSCSLDGHSKKKEKEKKKQLITKFVDSEV